MKELYRAKAAAGDHNLWSWSRLETTEGAAHQFMTILKRRFPTLPDVDVEVAREELRKAQLYIRSEEGR